MKVASNPQQSSVSGNIYSRNVLFSCKPISFTADKYGQLQIVHCMAVYLITPLTMYLYVYCTECTFMMCFMLTTAWSLHIEMCSVPVRYNT